MEIAPLLTSYDLRGTFYICPAGTDDEWSQRSRLWQLVLDAGHEIGNHTILHPAPIALIGEPSPQCSEMMTPDEFESDVLEARRRLEAAFDRREWTFCYPCYQTWVGTGTNRQSMVPFIAKHFAAACAGGEISKPYNIPGHCDLHALMSVRMEHKTGPQMIEHVEIARRMGYWAVLTFHGIDEGHLAVGRKDFETLLEHLRRNRADVWTAPLIDVARHVRSQTLLAAKAYGRLAFDSVFLDIKNLDGLRAETDDAVAVGFDGKVAIHPTQVSVIRDGYAPTEKEADWARRVLAAARDERGVFQFEGQMVDMPVLRRAERIVALAT